MRQVRAVGQIFICLLMYCAHAFEHFSANHSNNYRQYARYTSKSDFFSLYFYPNASVCEDFVAGNPSASKQTNAYYCLDRKTMATRWDYPINEKPHWNRTDGVAACRYNVTQVRPRPIRHASIRGGEAFHPSMIHLRIVQHDCSASYEESLGGSSFDAIAWANQLEVCDVVDRFDDTYDVYCPSRRTALHFHQQQHQQLKLGKEDSSSTHADTDEQAKAQGVMASNASFNLVVPFLRDGCLNVTIILDYEHFDAFSERGTLYEHAWKMIRQPLIENAQYCLLAHNNNNPPPFPALALAPFPETLPRSHPEANNLALQLADAALVTDGMWVLESPQFLADLSAQGIDYIGDRSNNSYFQSIAYKWEWKVDGGMMDRLNFVDCLAERRTIMVGESHMRYNWDSIALMDLNDEGIKNMVAGLDRKHGDVNTILLDLEHRLFAKNMANSIDEICDKVEMLQKQRKPSNTTLIVQTGMWDFTFWSAQKFIEYKDSARKMLDAIAFSKIRPCSSDMQIIYVSIPPYPHCQLERSVGCPKPDRQDCIDARSGRNNYAVDAANEFIKHELLKINYPNLQYVDSIHAIVPRLMFAEYACRNHFMVTPLSKFNKHFLTPHPPTPSSVFFPFVLPTLITSVSMGNAFARNDHTNSPRTRRPRWHQASHLPRCWTLAFKT